jgi:hypothetical protein
LAAAEIERQQVLLSPNIRRDLQGGSDANAQAVLADQVLFG